jgi:hypothetical protein
MKVPANLSADKLIMDYLARVTEAGLRYLPKGARIAFVGRTRALIERECGQAGLADPGRVMEVLAALGEPEELVRQERARIDAAWIKRRAGSRAAGEAAAAAVTAPRQLRPLTSRWKPATDTQPLPVPAPATPQDPSAGGPPGRPGRDASSPAAAASPAGGPPEQASPAGQASPVSPGGPAVSPARSANTGGPVVSPLRIADAGGPAAGPGGPAALATPAGAEGQAAPAGAAGLGGPAGLGGVEGTHSPADLGGLEGPGGPAGPGALAGTAGPGGPAVSPAGMAGGTGQGRPIIPGLGTAEGVRAPLVTGAPPPGFAPDRARTLARHTGRLARGHPLESAIVVLTGLGGLIFPVLPPVWFLGSLLALVSRVWDPRDKWAALLGPPVVALAASLPFTPFLGGDGNVIQLYSHALGLDFGYVLRFGCVVTAAYLAWRVHRGPRVKVPPWKR